MNTKTAIDVLNKMLNSEETYVEDRRQDEFLKEHEISGDYNVMVNDQLGIVVSTELYRINIYGLHSGKQYFSMKSTWKNVEKLVQKVNDRIYQ